MNIDFNDYAGDDDEAAPASTSPEELAKAYRNLSAGLDSALDPDIMQPTLDRFRNTLGLGIGTADMLARLAATTDSPNLLDSIPAGLIAPPAPPLHEIADIYSPTADIADHTAEVADLMRLQHEAIAQLVALTATSLQHTRAQQASAERTERFTRGMSWSSLVVAVASLGAAVGAIVVSLTTGSG